VGKEISYAFSKFDAQGPRSVAQYPTSVFESTTGIRKAVEVSFSSLLVSLMGPFLQASSVEDLEST